MSKSSIDFFAFAASRRAFGLTTPEFAGRMLNQWAYLNGITLDFSQRGKPTDNAFIEAFNSRLRQECLQCIVVPIDG